MGKNNLRPALAAFLLMLTMSLLSTALSFFVSPVCADLGFGRGSFTLYYSLMLSVMTAFVAVGSVAEGVLCSRFGIVKTLTTVLVLYAVGFGLLALAVTALTMAFRKGK